jgi:prophage maintenance system killer protein
VIERARDEAFAAGAPRRAPPQRLEDCDRPTIDSALASPRASFGGHEQYTTLPAKAAVLAYALAKSQACRDGNKRICLILVLEFLALNGRTIEATSMAVADMILRVAASARTERTAVIDELEAWFARVIVDLEESGAT